MVAAGTAPRRGRPVRSRASATSGRTVVRSHVVPLTRPLGLAHRDRDGAGRSRLARTPDRRAGGDPRSASRTPEAHLSPTAAPLPHDSGAWLARYGELQASLFVTLARQLGLGGPGGRDAFGDLFQIAVTA